MVKPQLLLFLILCSVLSFTGLVLDENLRNFKLDTTFMVAMGALLVWMGGVLSNFVVMRVNKGKMPTICPAQYIDHNHYVAIDKKETKLWFLSDAIKVSMSSYNYAFSLGDVFMGIATLVLGLNGLVSILEKVY